jgi:hypothetical protein
MAIEYGRTLPGATETCPPAISIGRTGDPRSVLRRALLAWSLHRCDRQRCHSAELEKHADLREEEVRVVQMVFSRQSNLTGSYSHGIPKWS